jgi:hypothetical protein
MGSADLAVPAKVNTTIATAADRIARRIFSFLNLVLQIRWQSGQLAIGASAFCVPPSDTTLTDEPIGLERSGSSSGRQTTIFDARSKTRSGLGVSRQLVCPRPRLLNLGPLASV